MGFHKNLSFTTVLVIIKLTKFAVSVRFRCGCSNLLFVFISYFVRRLWTLYKVWSLVRCRVTRCLTRLQTMYNGLQYRKIHMCFKTVRCGCCNLCIVGINIKKLTFTLCPIYFWDSHKKTYKLFETTFFSDFAHCPISQLKHDRILLLFISYTFVKSFLAILFLLLVFSNWNFYDVCQFFLYNQKRKFSLIRRKWKISP